MVESQPQRALANNSVNYKGRPDIGTFMREWCHYMIPSQVKEESIMAFLRHEASRKDEYR